MRTLVAICEVARPNTRRDVPPEVVSLCGAGSVQPWAIAPTTNDFPVPAGPTSDSTRAPEVSTPWTTAAWSTPSSTPEARRPSRNQAATGCGSAAAPLPAVAATRVRSVCTCSSVAYTVEPGLT